MICLNNTLSVRELRELLEQYPDDMSVVMAVNDAPIQINTVNHAIEMGWKAGRGDSIIELTSPTNKDRIGLIVALR